MRVLHEPAHRGLTAWRRGALLGAAAAIACSSDARDSATTVRDSAGVQIVENGARGSWSTANAWTVADTPSVSIGGDESDSTTLFSLVRSAAKLADGRIVVANYGTRQLRFYDANGRFLTASGGLGEGPGEFDWLGKALRVEGDSLVFWDPNNRRLSVFDSSGRFVRSVPLRSGQGVGIPEPLGRTSTGALLGRTGSRSNDVGAVRSDALFVLYGSDLAPIDTFAQRPGTERFIQPCGQGMCGYDPPFARATSAAFWRDLLFVGSADRYEIDVIGVDGREIRSIRAAAPSRKPAAADVARQRDDLLSHARDAERRKALEAVYALMSVPATLPAYRDLRVDRSGNLWVEDYRMTDDVAPRWTVFDSTGRMLGTLATPRSLRIDEIGDDYLIGVFRDSLDVEQVRMHRITKPRGP
jgi:hypothetical protein